MARPRADMVYIVQAEEREITFGLLQQLAAVVAESPGIAHADATHRIRSSPGILAVPDQAEAVRISRRFDEHGVRNFVLDQLLDLPEAERLSLLKPQLDERVELAVAARLDLVTHRRVREFSLWRVKVAYPRLVLPGSGVEERTINERGSHYSLDLFTRERHWQAQRASLLPMVSLLSELKAKGAYLSDGARSLVKRERHTPGFESKKMYDRYVTWLYHVRYAAS